MIPATELTAIIMVRDDAERLRRGLESLKGVIEKVIVLDTGSTDATVQTAKDHGAEVHETVWPGAFDVALNQLVGLVKSPWTLRMDSDEWLAEDQEANIRAMIEDENLALVNVMRRDLTSDGSFSDIAQPRLWRTHPEARYTGAIHEHFPETYTAPLIQAGKAATSEIVLWHDGYLEGFSEARLKRNLELIRGELELRPKQLYYEVCLVDTLASLNDPAWEAELNRLFDKILSSNAPPPDRLIAIPLGKYLINQPKKTLERKREQALLRYCEKHLYDVPTLVWVLAHCEAELGNLKKALDHFLMLDQMRETGIYDRGLAADPRIFTTELWPRIIELAPRCGKKQLLPYFMDLMNRR